MTDTTREIRLASRPEGEPVPENFELAEVPLPEPAAGEVVVRNSYLSVCLLYTSPSPRDRS